MATVKIVLRKEIKQDGKQPLAIRITKDRKTSYIYLDYRLFEKDWDSANERVRKSHKNSVKLNNFLLAKKAEASNEILELETNHKHVTTQAMRKRIKPNAQGSVFAQADLYISRLEADRKYNRHSADKPRVKHLKEFLKNDIAFSDFSISMIKRYKAWLKAEYQMSERTAINHLVVVRSIFSQAIDEKACDAKYYPFGKGKIQIRFPDSLKVGGTSEDVAAIEKLDLSEFPDLNHARNIWLFSFYFAGMRVSDVFRLKWADFQNGRLFYSMGKNNKGDSLKVPEKAQRILDQYADQKDDTDLVFPELKGLESLNDPYLVQMRIKTKLRSVNDDLKNVAKLAGITKKISMHISRHTFGNISGDTIPIQMLQKLYRHSTVTTTIGYQSSFINKSADDALDAVIG
jgi:integrase/recombinase XerD